MTEAKPPIAVVILAAGASSRLGRPKQLLRLDGKSLLRRTAEAALASRCDSAVAVLGANEPLTRAELVGLPLRIVYNETWADGLSTSLRVGLEALEEGNVQAAVFAACDQPALDAAVLNRLAAAHEATGKPIVVSGYGGTWGVPMLFARSLWPELKALHGDSGAKSVALRHADDAECVPFPQGACDIDTPEDYRELLKHPARELAAIGNG